MRTTTWEVKLKLDEDFVTIIFFSFSLNICFHFFKDLWHMEKKYVQEHAIGK